jgi:AraC-like DNA-binding protein
MQRRLHEQGTTFEEIKDKARRHFAERYFSEPDVPLSQVTALLDYSDQSALSRSCRRWFHATPGEYRNRVLSRTGLLTCEGIIDNRCRPASAGKYSAACVRDERRSASRPLAAAR